MHITIVDDIHENLLSFHAILEEEFQLKLIQNPLELIEYLKNEHTDLILLDLHMPEINGLDLYKKLQAQRMETPVIFVSGGACQESIVEGLGLGAHDFIVKPISSKELIARIKNRINLLPSLQDRGSIIKVGVLTMYCHDEIVDVEGKTIPLTPNEFKILKFLCRNKDRVFSKEELQKRLWPYHNKPSQHVESHISNMRKKLGNFRHHLRTIRSVGYVVKSTY
jgi:two-component system phosphate regulon response regulator PhoB